MRSPPPTILALIIADAVVSDAATGKHYIAGTFQTLAAVEFPAVLPGFALYLAVTEGHGTVALELRVVDADEQREPVFRGDIEARFPSPVALGEMAIRLPGALTFPVPGEYRVQVLYADRVIAERRLQVATISLPTETI
jgi:uncharacterized protein DUF6941